MSIKGKFVKVELLASREPAKETSLGLFILRQTEWGRRNGETRLQVWDWDDLERDDLKPGDLSKLCVEGCLDKRALLQIARGALIMAGLEELSKTLPEIQLHHNLTGDKSEEEGLIPRLERGPLQRDSQEEEDR